MELRKKLISLAFLGSLLFNGLNCVSKATIRPARELEQRITQQQNMFTSEGYFMTTLKDLCENSIEEKYNKIQVKVKSVDLNSRYIVVGSYSSSIVLIDDINGKKYTLKYEYSSLTNEGLSRLGDELRAINKFRDYEIVATLIKANGKWNLGKLTIPTLFSSYDFYEPEPNENR
jgi:REP element-mobilizing transposase RayT